MYISFGTDSLDCVETIYDMDRVRFDSVTLQSSQRKFSVDSNK